jgi:hypothetical protein
MPFDYLAAFPIPAHLLPERLLKLLSPVSLNPREAVEVACLYEAPDGDAGRERIYHQMAVVQDDSDAPLALLQESGDGVVAYSVPIDGRGNAADFHPSLSGHDYIVASWGSGSFYTYQLAEKVWMTLGLTPRCVGNDQQKLIYDDLHLPEFAVAEGQISNEYYWKSARNIVWSMSNDYLRKYLWLRAGRGVRAIYYETWIPDHPQIRQLMGTQKHVERKPSNGPDWCLLSLREHKQGLLMQVWATVEVAGGQPCPQQRADSIIWPGQTTPMTHEIANAQLSGGYVFLDDRFLEKYEQSAFYDTVPVKIGEAWFCSPSYKGQWDFTECVRVGRNLIKVPMRELYKPKPDREILHARRYARSPEEMRQIDRDAEHIVEKTQRLLDQILALGDHLSLLGQSVGLDKTGNALTGFSRAELLRNGWMAYPNLCKLAQVAPLDMTQQAFLSRCKQIHEILQPIPDGYLKSLLAAAGCPRAKIKDLKLLKLLEALLNIVQRLNKDEEALDAFASQQEPEGWNQRHPAMAPLFLNNDLRIADAHEAVGQCIQTLQTMGLDSATLNDGYGLALDFVLDRIIGCLETLNTALEQFLERSAP